MAVEGTFVWHELMTTDPQGAEAFYGKVTGWNLVDSGMPAMRYTLACVGDHRVAGIMAIPDEARAHGARPGWMGYVAVADVDAGAEDVMRAGGSVHRAPDDIPGIGRFAVVSDPQGAKFVLFCGNGTPPTPPAPGTPGHFGWNELYAHDWPAAFTFYQGLFGWRKDTAVDMGPMGTYQLFAPGQGAAAIGGMMSLPGPPAPSWLYYVNVDDIDAAGERVREAGGSIQNGPMEVPGGSWIIQAVDPWGASFALVGPRAGAPAAA